MAEKPIAEEPLGLLEMEAPDIEAAKRLLHDYATADGFTACISSSNSKRIYYACSKGGKYTNRAKGFRNGNTTKTNCPFKAVVKKTPTGARLELIHPHHNHEPYSPRDPHPSSRKLDLQAEEFIWTLSSLKLTNVQILMALQKHHPGENGQPGKYHLVTTTDIKNTVAKLRRERAAGLTATQTLIKTLQEQGLWHDYALDKIGRLQYLAFTFPWCLKMWRENWRFFSVDCTHDVSSWCFPYYSFVTN